MVFFFNKMKSLSPRLYSHQSIISFDLINVLFSFPFGLRGRELRSPRSLILPQLTALQGWVPSPTPGWDGLYLAKYKADQEKPTLGRLGGSVG
ncbi:unnamed protein product [Gulo gulo]|uniref:Uncharacterized protein n=1 Tax=Gulo gulo TaxID=48420 RepID=A0A9X9LEC5_GULGU|nr:unnamed protein product [Gulo gulo]